MIYRTAWLAAVAVAFSSTPAAAQDIPARDDSRYLYALDLDSAAQCGVLQSIWAQALQEDGETEPARQHTAMSVTWLALADGFLGRQITNDEVNAYWERLTADADPEADLTPMVQGLLRQCEVISTLYGAEYQDAANRMGELHAELYADEAAYKNQSDEEYPAETPRKEIMFDGNWAFFSRGNTCQAAPLTLEGMSLIFGFTNFFDGAISIESDSFPTLDAESDEYEAAMEAHRTGAFYDEELGMTRVADGFTYETYPGTALFIDDHLIGAPFGQGTSDGQKYVFGAYIQRDYYNLLPQGRELRLVMLGEEVRRIALPGPAFWNEMSNCMAQYPSG